MSVDQIVEWASSTSGWVNAPPDEQQRLEADIRPSRMKCVTLPLSVLQGALDGKEVAR